MKPPTSNLRLLLPLALPAGTLTVGGPLEPRPEAYAAFAKAVMGGLGLLGPGKEPPLHVGISAGCVYVMVRPRLRACLKWRF